MNDSPHPVRRALTPAELDTVLAGIAAAASPEDLVRRVRWNVLTPLLKDAGHSPESLDPDHPIGLYELAIPATQWQGIMAAAVDRAGEWGAAPVVFDLIGIAPATYEDPDVPVPDVPTVDHRPPVLDLHISREASDVIAACEAHLNALGQHYGTQSAVYQTALTGWHRNLILLMVMGLGADTHITALDTRSLLVRTASGLAYGIVFHPEHRRCTLDGCAAVIDDDGTAHPAGPDTPVADHQHQPSYPLRAPQPGRWMAHS